jgi:L-fucose mutarotase
MLKGIDPALKADVLQALCAMGHSDTLAITDLNFPSDAIARQSGTGKLLTIDNVSAPRAIKAILSVFPLDTPPQPSAGRKEVMGHPYKLPEVQREVQAAIDTSQGQAMPMCSIERFAFYEEAKKSYCVISTGETRFYECFLFTKGVIAPEEL